MSGEPVGTTGRTDWTALKFLYLRRVVATGFLSAGIEAATAAAKWMGREVYDLQTPAAARVLENLRAAFGDRLSEAHRRRLGRACFENIGSFWVEALFASRRLRGRSWQRFFEIPQADVLERLADADRPVIFVTTYFGNFVMGAFAIGQFCRPLHVVVGPQRHRLAEQWQDELFGLAGVRFIAKGQSLGRLPEILAAGGKVMLIGEHGRQPGRQPVVRYLNQDQACHPTVAILSQRYDAPVVVFGNRRLAGRPFRFCLDLAEAIDPRDFGEANATLAITQAYMSAMEGLVLSHPEQYLWTRRWVGD